MNIRSICSLLAVSIQSSNSFSFQNCIGERERRSFLGTVVGGLLIQIHPAPSFAKPSAPSAEEEFFMIRDASSTLNILLDNWEKATVECIYADVPRELLESKNKEQLLEKASTFALFDKSTSVVSCKKTNKKVRDYIGVTGKGPLVNVDKRMLKRNVAEMVDPDDLENYYTEVESFQSAIARASAASYAAGMSDFDSINNFEKGAQNDLGETNLDQAKKAVEDARSSIEKIVVMLEKAS